MSADTLAGIVIGACCTVAALALRQLLALRASELASARASILEHAERLTRLETGAAKHARLLGEHHDQLFAHERDLQTVHNATGFRRYVAGKERPSS